MDPLRPPANPLVRLTPAGTGPPPGAVRRFLGTFHARGQGDFSTVELWRFPDMEAAFEHWARMTDSGYAQWFAFTNTVGQSLKEAP